MSKNEKQEPIHYLNYSSCKFSLLNLMTLGLGPFFVEVVYESATLKYFFGILTKGRYVHSFDFFGLKI